jgi:uncharacterized protein (DUF1697 family)
MRTFVALLRGINVGKAKRIAMADLRELFGELGHRDVRTLLASGNVIFRTTQSSPGKLSAGIEAAIEQRFGFRVAVVVLTADELAAIVADPPAKAGRDPARLLVAFVGSDPALQSARALLREAWAPEALAVGPRAAYLWCADGILASKLLQAFTRATGDAATTRNWTTVLKLAAAIGDQGHNPG